MNNHEQVFRYNVTSPSMEQLKKKNRVDILVDRVKKLKRQAPRVGHYDQYKQDYSDYLVGQTVTSHNLVNRIKKYHQDHYQSNGALFNFSSSSSAEEEEQEERRSRKKKRFLKKSQDISSSTSSIPNNSRRHKLMSSLSQKRKKKKQLLLVNEEQKKQDERLQIRHKMINFVIPADWTSCIDNTTKSRDIFLSHQLLLRDLIKTIHDQQLNIEYEMNRITTHQLEIQEYKQKLLKLNHSIHTLPPLLPQNVQKDNQVYKILNQAYRQHLRLVKKMDKFKHTINTSLRLDYLQLKVQQSQTASTTTWPYCLLMPWCAFMLFYFFFYAFY